MRIFVAGATGRVADRTIAELVARTHEVTAGARDPGRVTVRDRVRPVHLDLHDGVDELGELVAGHDAVYFLAGSRGTDLLATDAFGAVKLARAAQEQGVSRFIMLSFLFSLQPDQWSRQGLDRINDYCIAKFFADNYLAEQSGLDWTIVQPGTLTEEPGTGLIELDPPATGPVPIADVAHALILTLTTPGLSRRTVPLIGGQDPIDEALAAF